MRGHPFIGPADKAFEKFLCFGIRKGIPFDGNPLKEGAEGSYLVDPASSHMLVSKIKPCMSKYKLLIL